MKLKLTPNILWPIVILIIALFAIYTKPWVTKQQEVVSVTSTGTAHAAPDVAQFTATLETKNPNLEEARKQNEQKVSTLISALKTAGIEDKDIKTSYISAGQSYDTQTLIYPPHPTTNQSTTTLEITIRNFSDSNKVLQALTQNGATNIYGPNLAVSNETLEEAKKKARQNAVENAKSKAQDLANLSNRKINKAVKIQEQGDYALPKPLLATGGQDLEKQASQIQPGQSEVTVNLLVDFSLK